LRPSRTRRVSVRWEGNTVAIHFGKIGVAGLNAQMRLEKIGIGAVVVASVWLLFYVIAAIRPLVSGN
jgi:hypothetical protein